MAASLSRDVWVVQDASQQKLLAHYIAAALQGVGMCARYIDWNARAETFVADVELEQPRLIVFSVLFANRLDEYLTAIAQLRAAGVRAHLTMAGHLPALAYAQLL